MANDKINVPINIARASSTLSVGLPQAWLGLQRHMLISIHNGITQKETTTGEHPEYGGLIYLIIFIVLRNLLLFLS